VGYLGVSAIFNPLDAKMLQMKTSLKERVAQHPFMLDILPEHLEIILHHAQETDFDAGTIILKEGDTANSFFLIESGHVIIEEGTNPQRIIQRLGPGEEFGWSWLFPPFSWHFSVRAVDAVRCIVLDGAHMLVTAEKNSKFGYDLMRRISQILISRLQAARKSNVRRMEATHEEISRLATGLYEREGRPEGKALEHWFNAESMIGNNFGFGGAPADYDFHAATGVANDKGY